MKIDKHNYEIFALEYLEGSLPANKLAEMDCFLQNNPAILKTLNEMANNLPLPSPNHIQLSALDKEQLHKIPEKNLHIASTANNAHTLTQAPKLIKLKPTHWLPLALIAAVLAMAVFIGINRTAIVPPLKNNIAHVQTETTAKNKILQPHQPSTSTAVKSIKPPATKQTAKAGKQVNKQNRITKNENAVVRLAEAINFANANSKVKSKPASNNKAASVLLAANTTANNSYQISTAQTLSNIEPKVIRTNVSLKKLAKQPISHITNKHTSINNAVLVYKPMPNQQEISSDLASIQTNKNGSSAFIEQLGKKFIPQAFSKKDPTVASNNKHYQLVVAIDISKINTPVANLWAKK